MVRTQIYLDGRQRRLLAERAKLGGTTVSDIVRRAIDAELDKVDPDDQWRDRWSHVVASTSGIAPSLPPGPDYVDRIRAEERSRRRS